MRAGPHDLALNLDQGDSQSYCVPTHPFRQSYAIQTDMYRPSYAFYVGFKAEW